MNYKWLLGSSVLILKIIPIRMMCDCYFSKHGSISYIYESGASKPIFKSKNLHEIA